MGRSDDYESDFQEASGHFYIIFDNEASCLIQSRQKKKVRPEKTVSAQNGSLSAAKSEPLAIDYYRNTETASGISFFNCYLGI